MRGDGSSNEERLKTGRKYRTDRTEGISDGVFAVSLTLLILDVQPPEGGVSQLVHGLVLIAPRLGTFALSFAIIAYYWLVHNLVPSYPIAVKIVALEDSPFGCEPSAFVPVDGLGLDSSYMYQWPSGSKRHIGVITRLAGDRQFFAFEEDYIDDPKRPTLSLSFKGSTGGLVTQTFPPDR